MDIPLSMDILSRNLRRETPRTRGLPRLSGLLGLPGCWGAWGDGSVGHVFAPRREDLEDTPVDGSVGHVSTLLLLLLLLLSTVLLLLVVLVLALVLVTCFMHDVDAVVIAVVAFAVAAGF